MNAVRMLLALALVAGCDASPGKDDTGAPGDTGADPTDTGATGGGDCTGAGTGSLAVDLGDPGAGPWVRAPEAVVFGPDGAEVARLTTSTTLEDLAGGDYVVEIRRGEGQPGGGRIGSVTTATSPLSRVCVGDGLTTSVSTGWVTADGRLWVSSGERLAAFGGAQLDAGGDRDPEVQLDVRLVNDFRGFAFDRMGHLWAATGVTYGTRLMWWAPGRVGGAGESEADGELSAAQFADFADLHDVAFGHDGTLWAALRRPGGEFEGLVGFSRATLAAAVLGGADVEVEPDVVRPVDGLAGPVDLEVGPDGALWIAHFDGDRLLRIDDPRDGGTGVDAEVVVRSELIPGPPEVLAGPANLAFEDDGGAVALFWTSNAVVALDAGDLAGTGSIEVVVGADLLSVTQLPDGLVIDGVGDAWIGNYAGNGFGELLRWNAGASPAVGLVSDEIIDPTDLVLDPRPR